MSSLFMGAIASSAPPPSEEVVRNTATPVIPDQAPAEASHAPDINEVMTDSNPNLGMVNRTLASAWHQPQKYAPSWAPDVDAVTESQAIINNQVSSSGTAAARELAGQFGHGTIAFAEGIEPVQGLTDGGQFGEHYFAVDHLTANEGSGNYMSQPPGLDDHATVSRTAAAGKTAARAAQTASMYSAFLNGETWTG